MTDQRQKWSGVPRVVQNYKGTVKGLEKLLAEAKSLAATETVRADRAEHALRQATLDRDRWRARAESAEAELRSRS